MKKEYFEDTIKWAQQNPKNRKKAIQASAVLIEVLNTEKHLTDEELKTISGGISSNDDPLSHLLM